MNRAKKMGGGTSDDWVGPSGVFLKNHKKKRDFCSLSISQRDYATSETTQVLV